MVKCTQYWPNEGSQRYANITVTLKNTINLADFSVRHFQIKSVSDLSGFIPKPLPSHYGDMEIYIMEVLKLVEGPGTKVHIYD